MCPDLVWDYKTERKIFFQNFYLLFPTEHAAPPKKPPRPGAQSQVGSLACLNTGDSYNDGVKVHTHGYPKQKYSHTNMHKDLLIKKT